MVEDELGTAGSILVIEFCNGDCCFSCAGLARKGTWVSGSIFGFIGCRFQILYGCVSRYLAYKILGPSLSWQIDPCGSISAMCLRSTTYPCYNSELKARLMIWWIFKHNQNLYKGYRWRTELCTTTKGSPAEKMRHRLPLLRGPNVLLLSATITLMDARHNSRWAFLLCRKGHSRPGLEQE